MKKSNLMPHGREPVLKLYKKGLTFALSKEGYLVHLTHETVGPVLIREGDGPIRNGGSDF